MDELETLLGTELFNQVKEKLGDKKLIFDDGRMIPKSRLDEVTEQKNSFKAQIDALNKDLDGLKKSVKDNEGASAKIKELQDAITAKEAESAAITKKFAVREALKNAECKHPELFEGRFDLAKIEMDGDKIKGFDDLLKPIKEQYVDQFGTVKVAGIRPVEGVINPKPDSTPETPKAELKSILFPKQQ